MSKLAYVSFVVALLAAVNLIPQYSNKEVVDIEAEKSNLIYVSVISILGFLVTLYMIPKAKGSLLKANLFGRDLNKSVPEDRKVPVPEEEKVPESLGIISGSIYLICVILFQPFFTSTLGQYNAGVLSICFMLLLGFSDDVLDVRWRYKIALSALATLPLLVAYDGPTDILIPRLPGLTATATVVHLGVLYHAVIACISIFCTNSINIHAGVNGIEAGQSVVISLFIIAYNAIELHRGSGSVFSHQLSLYMILPFVGTSLALLYYNWCPSEVFVGDSFTYIAGMTISVAAVLGHFTKTVLLFFIPQLINFTLSLPQLFGIIPCPRHRLPKYNKKTGLLEPVWPDHYTLINLVLKITGPMKERNVTVTLLLFQAACCVLGLAIRYSQLSTLFIGE